MKINLIVIMIGNILFFSCSGKYTVKNMNDEFSDPKAPIFRVLDNNAIIHHDPTGMVPTTELNAYKIVDRSSNVIKEMGIYLQHVDDNRNLFIKDNDELIIIADTNRIVLYAKSSSSDYFSSGWNSISRKFYDYHFDFALYPCSMEQFKIISNSKLLKLKIYGQNGIREYGLNNEILSGCVSNLKKFYEMEIINK